MDESLVKRMQDQAAFWAKSSVRFVDDEFLNQIESMDRNTIDSKDFGILKLDDTGKILIYNKLESDKANVAVSEAEGKNFFKEVAPCTNNAIFSGTFQKSVSDGHVDLIFPYTFTYKMKPTPVVVHLYRKQGSKNNWVFIKWK